MKTIPIKITMDHERYARALSIRVGGCSRPTVGSVAYGFKWALEEQARREGLTIFSKKK